MQHSNTFSAIVIVTVIIMIGFLIIGKHDLTEIHSNQQSSNKIRSEIVTTKNQEKQLSINNALKSFSRNHANIGIIEHNTRNRIQKAFTLACKDQNNNKTRAKAQRQIQMFLGQEFSQDIINDTQPVTANGNPSSHVDMSQKINDTQIGFGRFNTINNTMPMYVMVKYQTAPFVNGSGTGAMHKKPIRQTKYATFHVLIKIQNTYNVKYQVVSHLVGTNYQRD